ncbi:hypothetical protein [Kitasatospora aureofaciens]|uniref:hypothetical protein n=1 Tax=Kitasatospora aureofaciens TaxID=1894 RepID=UPI000526E290|nr:hypothetical protein [Kitasatospora aureofaciens]
MTVLHSRNADAADPADVADAADVKDPQDAAAEPDLREDLGRYADLGAFTLSADTHAWYAAVDTVATPEDARAASTALAELRGRDLHQTWEAVTALAAEAKLDEPDTVAKAALLVEMLQRVHRTSATLSTAAYDADLVALAAATADSTWRRENGVKLSWLRARSLRKQATALAHDRKVRREDLHEALTSAEIERRAWAALAPAGSLPSVPADGDLVDRTAQAFEPINTGLRGLARLLPDHDLDGLAFAELADLVERLAADEGTLYRLPTIRGLRATLEEAGLADLLAELTAAKADRRAAEAAYAARQALVAGQRDGLAAAPVVEDAGTADADAEAEAAARQALAGGQRDGLTEETVVETVETVEADTEEPVTETVDDAEAEAENDVEASDAELTDVEAEAAARQALAGGQRDGLTEETPVSVTAPVEETAEAQADAEVVEAASASGVDSAGTESVVEEAVTEEAAAAVVSLPAPSPAADDLVAAATAEAAAADEVAVEAETAEAEEPAVEVEADAEVEPEAVEAEVAVEAPAAEAVEPVTDAEAVEEAPAVTVEEPEAEVEEPVVEDAADAEVEPEAVEAEVAVEAPAAEAETPVAEEPAGRPAKPDFTPGRPVTAYSADELLAVVRWIDTDGTERSDEELLRAAMKELGFARLGPRIKEALGAAVAAARG